MASGLQHRQAIQRVEQPVACGLGQTQGLRGATGSALEQLVGSTPHPPLSNRARSAHITKEF